MSTFRTLVYKLLVEFEQQLIFKVRRVHPGSLCIEPQSSNAEESLAGGVSSHVVSRGVEVHRARFALNSNAAQLKSRSQAAEAGRPVLSFRDSFLIFCKAFSTSILTETQAKDTYNYH